MQTFLSSISPSLNAKVKGCIFSVVLGKNEVLEQPLRLSGDRQATLDFIIRRMNIHFVAPETQIIMQGESIEEGKNLMYFLERGECMVTVRDKQKLRNADKKVRSLFSGEYFGVRRNGNCLGNRSLIQLPSIRFSLLHQFLNSGPAISEEFQGDLHQVPLPPFSAHQPRQALRRQP